VGSTAAMASRWKTAESSSCFLSGGFTGSEGDEDGGSGLERRKSS
jgi:hypothetical protein